MSSSKSPSASRKKPRAIKKQGSSSRGKSPTPTESEVVEGEVIIDAEEIDGDPGSHSLVPQAESEEVIDPEIVFDEPEAMGDESADDDSLESTALAAETHGLVQSSPLSRYLAEVRRYALLSRDEERELATRSYENDDLDARNKLVTSNLRLVVKIAMEYRRTYVQILDLIQEGNAGLVQAVNRFNPYRDVKLSTYSAWWIRAYILKFLMDNKSLVRMGTTDAQRKLFFRLRSEAERIYALTQRYDTKAIAGSIGVKEKDVVEMQQRLKSDVSLDAPVDESGETRMVDRFSSEFDPADQALERDQIRGLVRKSADAVLSTLNDRDAYIFEKRLMAEEPITLQEVGDKYGISRERARQLEARVIKKIKAELESTGVSLIEE